MIRAPKPSLKHHHTRGHALRQAAIALLVCAAVTGGPTLTFAQDNLLAASEMSGNIEPAPIVSADSSNGPAVDINPPLPVAEAEADLNAPEPPPSAEISAAPRRFHYALRLTIRGVYDDNINVSHTNRISDFITAIEPGIMVGFGDINERQENYVQFVYAPSIFLYADHDEANAVQHLLHLEGQYHFSRLTVRLSQDVQILDGSNLDIATGTDPVHDRVNVDVGGRTRVNIYTTNLGGSYYLSGKTFLSSQLGAAIYDYSTLLSSQAMFGNLFINYAYSEKLTFGFGGGGGYNFVDEPTPDQTFQQALARFDYNPSGKIKITASGGVEFRESDGNDNTYVSPVFGLGLDYHPFDGSSVRMDLNRRVNNSAVLTGQDYTTTSITASVRQRLLRRFSVGVTGGYENSDYFSVVNGVQSDRNDDYFFIQPAVDVNVTRFWTVGAYYLRRQNSSSLETYSFHDNQVGIRTSLTF